jgi:hypothetical protein
MRVGIRALGIRELGWRDRQISAIPIPNSLIPDP